MANLWFVTPPCPRATLEKGVRRGSVEGGLRRNHQGWQASVEGSDARLATRREGPGGGGVRGGERWLRGWRRRMRDAGGLATPSARSFRPCNPPSANTELISRELAPPFHPPRRPWNGNERADASALSVLRSPIVFPTPSNPPPPFAPRCRFSLSYPPVPPPFAARVPTLLRPPFIRLSALVSSASCFLSPPWMSRREKPPTRYADRRKRIRDTRGRLFSEEGRDFGNRGGVSRLGMILEARHVLVEYEGVFERPPRSLWIGIVALWWLKIVLSIVIKH